MLSARFGIGYLVWGSHYSREELAKKYPGYGTTFIYFPDDDDIPMKVYLNFTNLTGARLGMLGFEDYDLTRYVTLTYYSRAFSKGIALTGFETLNWFLMRNKPVRFITHGWMSDATKDMAINLTNGFLNKYDANIFVVDWSRISKNIFYPIPMMATWEVGNHIAKYLNYLTDNLGVDPGDIHMVGHSLGAHVSGFAARAAKGRIGRVTGLDPALPGFSVGLVEGGTISAEDAQFVDIIHTCAGFLGYKEPLGHVDFYPNGGTPPQPGCTILELVEACSHGKSWKIFASSLLNTDQHMAYKCRNFSELARRRCLGESIPIGDSTPSVGRGVYYADIPEIDMKK
ncbi:lipase member H-B-like [Cylas formicarius]|uniref:lipase member H-B-like n=1 Tax=Cylas formicarius TaxID=197179 RepID=UPI0029589517|nr:lipase member H-B-like [Cylas formicarius]